MEIIEYNEKYKDGVKKLLVELQEYIVSIDKEGLNILTKEYRDGYYKKTIEELSSSSGKLFIAVEEENVIGMIMGTIVKYSEEDKLDYKCPIKGKVHELIVTNKYKSNGIGQALMNRIEEFFKDNKCEYISIEVFGYNERAISFYEKCGYHTRMIDMIMKIK